MEDSLPSLNSVTSEERTCTTHVSRNVEGVPWRKVPQLIAYLASRTAHFLFFILLQLQGNSLINLVTPTMWIFTKTWYWANPQVKLMAYVLINHWIDSVKLLVLSHHSLWGKRKFLEGLVAWDSAMAGFLGFLELPGQLGLLHYNQNRITFLLYTS